MWSQPDKGCSKPLRKPVTEPVCGCAWTVAGATNAGQKLLALPTCPHYVFVVSSEHHEKRNDSFNGPVGINTVRIRALLRLYERQFGDQRSKRQAVQAAGSKVVPYFGTFSCIPF